MKTLLEYLSRDRIKIKPKEYITYKFFEGEDCGYKVRGVVICAKDFHEFKDEFSKYEYCSSYDNKYYNLYHRVEKDCRDYEYILLEYFIGDKVMNVMVADDYKNVLKFIKCKNEKEHSGTIFSMIKSIDASNAIKNI